MDELGEVSRTSERLDLKAYEYHEITRININEDRYKVVKRELRLAERELYGFSVPLTKELIDSAIFLTEQNLSKGKLKKEAMGCAGDIKADRELRGVTIENARGGMGVGRKGGGRKKERRTWIDIVSGKYED
ncbi:hypothetical protein ACFL1Q_01835 [Patescibacteria group bacterium]